MPSLRKPRAKKQPQPQPIPAAPTRCRPTDEDGGFAELLPLLRSHFDAAVADVKQPLFHTDAGAAKPLYDVFLDNLPAELRKHYECRCCRAFVKRYGDLVTVDGQGRQRSVMWGLSHNYAAAPVAFRTALSRLDAAITATTVVGVFLSADLTLGTPSTIGEDPVDGSSVTWTHFHAVLPAQRRFSSLVKTLEAAVAERREEYGMLKRGLDEFGVDVVQKALALLTSGTLQRPEKGEPLARWLLDLHARLKPYKGQQRDNLVWLASVQAPAGFCRVRSGMLGTMLEDLQNGLDVAAVSKRWAEKVDPAQYMRAQVAPAAGNLKRAESVIQTMEAAGALRRRYAVKVDVAEFLWQPRCAEVPPAATAGPVFGHITPKQKAPLPRQYLDLGDVKMTWEKFKRTVLPIAERVEYQVPATTLQLAALVTATDPAAPPILQWDGDGTTSPRNPVSVYSQQAEPQRWGLQPGSFVDVDFATAMPYHWNGASSPQHKEGVLLALKGCRDQHRIAGGGFLPEFLRSEFREIRSSLDAYAKSSTVEGKEAAECCGLALMKAVETATGTQVKQFAAGTRIIIVLDESGSMTSHSGPMSRQAKVIATTLQRRLPDAVVEVCRFGTQPSWERPTMARQLEYFRAGDSNRGGTSLYYTLAEAAERAMLAPEPTLLYLLTDGRNESSLGSPWEAREGVAGALATGRVTFGCVGPTESANFFADCGIPAACVRLWSTYSRGDLDAITEQVGRGIDAFADARSRGLASIDDFFTAPVSGFGDGVRLRVTTGQQRQVVVLDRWD